ncbi:MAG: M14 family zinc carboxypeptidase [Pyrinomonadaceae bacterium]
MILTLMSRRTMRKTTVSVVTTALIIAVATLTHTYATHQPTVSSPADVLGFTPGDDRKLASWDQVIQYFNRLANESDRVKFETLGQTTMGKPFVMATISAPENLRHLDAFRAIQDQLADPRKLGPAAGRDRRASELIRRGKTIVLITCGIHSTEVGSYLSSMLIAYRLASSNEADIQNILHNTIILLVPSLNPDGVDIVKNWYDKTLGTTYEGTDPPELYHKYTGHDDNRDWYAFTQVETQITVEKIHNVWHPQIVHDIHQQGAAGSRLFLPPYMQPVEPNVPKQIVDGYTELGNYMAASMRAQGFKGITTNSTYDAWTPSRAYSHYHGGVRILSETASCKIATPIHVKFEDLSSREGYDPKKESANFGPLWGGGEWHLKDITHYMTTAAFLLVKHASDNREHWLKRFYEIGKEAVRARKAGELYAIVIPDAKHQPDLLETFDRGDVEIETALPFRVGGTRYGKNTAVIRLNQPYGLFAKALVENQHYPDLRDATGHPIAPYDVTAHTLSLLMGVDVRFVTQPFAYKLQKKTGMNSCTGFGEIDERVALYRSHVPAMDEGWTRWIMEQQHFKYDSIEDKAIQLGGIKDKYDAIIIPDQAPRAILNGYRAGTMPPELTSGLGQDGVRALREFVESGGTLVCLNRASDFAIEQFKLPLRDVVAGLPRTDFYVPGSILRLELDTANPLAEGMSRESIAWAEDSPVFEIINDNAPKYSVPANAVHVVGWYPRNTDPLLSGWLLGGNRIKGKAALVAVSMGKGRIILFGFRPQYRGQSLATYPLLFNSISRRN